MRMWKKSRPNYYRDLYNRLFNELRKSFGGKCIICGQYLYDLEFAHIKETGLSGLGRGKIARYYDIKNHPECYVLMCKNHHREFDRISPELKEEWLQKTAKFNKAN
jgi:predicted restriction endonuclease